jgi:hypothetical protein
MDSDVEMMMELLMQDETATAADHQQWMMVLVALLHYREDLLAIPCRVIQGLGRRRTRIGIDLQVLFCLTQIILQTMQQIHEDYDWRARVR